MAAQTGPESPRNRPVVAQEPARSHRGTPPAPPPDGPEPTRKPLRPRPTPPTLTLAPGHGTMGETSHIRVPPTRVH